MDVICDLARDGLDSLSTFGRRALLRTHAALADARAAGIAASSAARRFAFAIEDSGHGPEGPRGRLSSFLLPVSALLIGLLAPGFPGVGLIELDDWHRIVAASILSVSLGTLGASVVLARRGSVRGPLVPVRLPSGESEEPLSELRGLAIRAASRLRSSYRAQLAIAIGMVVLLSGIVAWSALMVAVGKIKYATVLGVGGVGATALTARWQPFDRVGRARALAEQSDVLATGLRLRLASIQEISDPVARHNAEWEAVRAYTQEAWDGRAPAREKMAA